MRFDLAFPLIDCQDNPNMEWYRAAAKMMIASARFAYQNHDMRVVQITDEASEAADDIDVRFHTSPKVERDVLMQYRGHCTAEWALHTDRPVIFCDVDLLWNTDALTGCLQPIDDSERVPGIVLCQRPNLLQPFNGGLIMTQPGQRKFWEMYRGMMRHLPTDLRGWWGDQIALGVMVGAPDGESRAKVKFGSSIAYLPADIVAPSPKQFPMQVLENPAVHLKGNDRKAWIVDYFKLLQAKWAAESASQTRIAV